MIQPATFASSADAIITRLRPRSVGEILDQAFRVYRKHFLTFLAIIAVVHLPLQVLIQGITITTLGDITSLSDRLVEEPATSQTVNEAFISIGIAYTLLIVLSLLYWLFQYLSQGALTAAIMDSYTDRPVSFGTSYRAMFRRVGPLLGSMALQLLILLAIFIPVILLFVAAIAATVGGGAGEDAGLAVMCCGFLLIIPAGALATYVVVRYTLAVPAVMAENLGPVESLRRSWRLIQNYWWRTAGMLILLSILSSIISAGPGYFIAMLVALVTRSFDQIMINAIVSSVSVITTMFFIPIQLASVTLYYFDLRTRKEGFDLEAAIAQRYGSYGTPTTAMPLPAIASNGPHSQPTTDLISPPTLGGAAQPSPHSAYSQPDPAGYGFNSTETSSDEHVEQAQPELSPDKQGDESADITPR